MGGTATAVRREIDVHARSLEGYHDAVGLDWQWQSANDLGFVHLAVWLILRRKARQARTRATHEKVL